MKIYSLSFTPLESHPRYKEIKDRCSCLAFSGVEFFRNWYELQMYLRVFSDHIAHFEIRSYSFFDSDTIEGKYIELNGS